MPTPKVKPGVKTGLDASTDQVYDRILDTYLSASDLPGKDRLIALVRKRDYASLLAWTDTISPQLYGDAASYFAECQFAALIKKYPFTSDEVEGISPEATAVRKFLASEHRCKRVNQRFRARRNCRRFRANAMFWQTAREFIVSVIGVKPDVSDILGKCNFTAGASMGVHGNKTNLARKFFAQSWTCTPGVLPYAITALWKNVHARDCILPGAIKCYDPEEFRSLVRHKVERVSCNNITFVPKTAKTHRSIAVEPLLNGFVQKGIDVALREKLRAVGIDLSDQTPNQVLAFAGSLGGRDPFCTIDLSAASDSLAIEVVRDLLPPEWYEFLADARAPLFTLGSQTFRYEKFCSMGNGFCFPLQTLIFASVCHASLRETGGRRRNFAVYGDDIVVPRNEALLVIERLSDIGFKINADKTFITGPFRESCGRDWFAGRDVRPVSLKDRISDVRQLFAFHNTTWRSQACSFLFEEVRTYLRSLRPQFLRPGVEPGDTCFSVPLDLAMTSPLVRWSRSAQRWTWAEIISKPAIDRCEHLSVAQRQHAGLYAILSGSKSDGLFPTRYTTKAIKRVVSRPWSDAIRTVFGCGGSVALDPSLCRNRRGPTV